MSETKDIPVLEMIAWKAVSDELPDAGTEVLVCYERNDGYDRDVLLAVYDDSEEDEGPWFIMPMVSLRGIAMYWSDMPAGPEREDE